MHKQQISIVPLAVDDILITCNGGQIVAVFKIKHLGFYCQTFILFQSLVCTKYNSISVNPYLCWYVGVNTETTWKVA